MYAYSDFDRSFVHARAAQYREQLQRHLSGELPDAEFRPLRLQNGWYLQRHAPMLRVAVPYGVISSAQLRTLAHIARQFDRGYAHATTRQNVQFNWIPIEQSADVIDALAEVDMHGIQTSGNCIRNITTDSRAGIAPDEVSDPRPWCELIRQWSTLHPEFAYLPRKFKIAVSASAEDRAATRWHDVGLFLRRNEADELGFEVAAGGGMGRTPIVAPTIRSFVPARQILSYLEAVLRVYNQFGRRDNLYKARIKILVKAEGQTYIDAVEAEFAAIVASGAPHDLPQSEVDRISESFKRFARESIDFSATEKIAPVSTSLAFSRWLVRNVWSHRLPQYRAVVLSLKRPGQAPGDMTSAQMEAAAALSDRFSQGELRVTHEQNLLLPWVKAKELPAVFDAAQAHGFATPNIGLLTDMICCPGGDFCALANARSLPISEAIAQRYQDLDELFDLGDIDLHISGCINSCGHHHSGHIGILGVDKDGQEWYQITLGGADGSGEGVSRAGKVLGPSFCAEEVPDVIEAILSAYTRTRHAGEPFAQTVSRLGLDPFKSAANAVRNPTEQTA